MKTLPFCDIFILHAASCSCIHHAWATLIKYRKFLATPRLVCRVILTKKKQQLLQDPSVNFNIQQDNVKTTKIQTRNVNNVHC